MDTITTYPDSVTIPYLANERESATADLPAEVSDSKQVAVGASLTLYTATSFLHRLRGLLGRRELNSHEALHIQPCGEVHSFGMRYPLDIVFLDANGTVLDVKALMPKRWIRCRKAKSVIELPLGHAKLHGFSVGKNLDQCPSNITRISIGKRKNTGDSHE